MSARAKLMRWPGRLALIACLLFGLVGAWSGATFAAFTSPADNPGNVVTAAPDWRGPTVSGGAGKLNGPLGYARQGDNVYLFLNVDDTGNPASGVQSVTASVTVPGYGTVNLLMTAGTYTVRGQTYNYRSDPQTIPPLADQTLNVVVTATDNAGNATNTTIPFAVDNTGPTASAIQTANKAGGILGRPEQGDTITYTFSEPMDPYSIINGWDGSASNVTLRFNDNVRAFGRLDTVTIHNGSTTIPLGTVNLGDKDFVGGTVDFADSQMTMTGNAITIVLGTTGSSLTTGTGNNTMQWSPSATATDIAANAMATTVRDETGTDRDF